MAINIDNIESIVKPCSSCSVPDSLKMNLCSVCITQKITRGKWKFVIIWLLRDGKKRFSELQRAIPQIKHGPLSQQLKELVNVGLVRRTAYNVVPPKVEYSLTENGKSFIEVLNVMDSWGKQYINNYIRPISEQQKG